MEGVIVHLQSFQALFVQSYETDPITTICLTAGVVVAHAAFTTLLFAMIQTSAYERNERAYIDSLLADLRAKADAAVPPLTALITGANSGIGFKLAQTLAAAKVRVILGCRSAQRGNDAVQRILQAVPGSSVQLLILDVSDPSSVLSACAALKSDPRYGLTVPGSRLDALVCNAGIMPVSHYRLTAALQMLLSGNPAHFFETSRAAPNTRSFLAQPLDELGVAGAPSMLATHVLGHLMMVQELQAELQPISTAVGTRVGRVIWTGSRSACAAVDWSALSPPARVGAPSGLAQQLQNGSAVVHDTYGEAKYMQDLVNASLSSRVPHPCIVICPGYVDTELTPLFFKIFTPFFLLIRAYLPGFNITAERGIASQVVALLAPASGVGSLSPECKWVLAGDHVARATNGAPPITRELREQAWAYCSQWLNIWRQHAAAQAAPQTKAVGAATVSGTIRKASPGPAPTAQKSQESGSKRKAQTPPTAAATAPKETSSSAKKSLALRLLELSEADTSIGPVVPHGAGVAGMLTGAAVTTGAVAASAASARKSPGRGRAGSPNAASARKSSSKTPR